MAEHASELYHAEPPDRGCAGAAEASLQAVFRDQAEPGTKPLRVECRTTLCRIELEHDSVKSRDSLMHSLAGKLPWDGSMFSPPPGYADGRLRSSIYLAREGFPIEGIAD